METRGQPVEMSGGKGPKSAEAARCTLAKGEHSDQETAELFSPFTCAS